NGCMFFHQREDLRNCGGEEKFFFHFKKIFLQ
ncbi:MAG: hypothetical protein ACI8RD_013885, partial [Bacillariaceae sp.]